MWISTGKNRKDTHWKNIQIEWIDLVKKLKLPIRTKETLKEYVKLTKAEQLEIKDVGGYVGGSIRGGNRLKNSVECRTLLTLESDENCSDLWETFCLLYGCKAVIHSTHSSTPENLRLRLIIPLDRECFIDEYEAIVRKVADSLGMNYFDQTSFQAERLMYWPSVCKDATYVFEEQEGPFLNVTEVLSEYRDWKDISQWPLHPLESTKIKTEVGKQENPLEKSGVIGAFCRAYNIHEAIEKYLKDIYEPTDLENRYTYKQGSTAAGVVVYDDLYSYSHHATDKAGGMLCNAFDLVRISLFGEMDEGSNVSLPPFKKPSFIKCCELLLKDSKVKKGLVQAKLKEAKEDFTELNNGKETTDKEEEKEPEQEEWISKLETDKKGNCFSTTNNIVLILQNDKHFKDTFKWDAFNHRLIIANSTYWKKINKPCDTWIDDNDKANIRHYLENMYSISGKDKINDALLIVAYKNKFHPVLDYLQALVWDEVERLDSLLIDYLGAEDNEYTRAVTRKTFVAAVARIFEPGIKFDNMLMLVGKQGMGKSTILSKMAGAWFSDNVGNLHDKSSMEQLRGVWIMEIPELAAMKKTDVETIKSFLSRQEDRFRQSFGETLTNFPRQCVFVGTTNEDEFLVDTTGNRRFWPVVLKNRKSNKDVFNVPATEISQLWAEAVYYYSTKEPLYLEQHISIMAEKIQEEHTEQESYTAIIETYLHKKIPGNWYELSASDKFSFLQGDSLDFNNKEEEELTARYKVSPLEIWVEALKGRTENFKKHEAKSIKNAMKKIKGWEYKVIKIGDLPTRGWMKVVKDTVTK